ncbi:hypothetical protein NFI96_030864, partial [Prochilodus magdalenae]
NDNEDDPISTEDDMNYVSNSEDHEVNSGNSSTTSLLSTDIQENEGNLSDSEGSMLGATRSETGKDVDTEDLMEGNTIEELYFKKGFWAPSIARKYHNFI